MYHANTNFKELRQSILQNQDYYYTGDAFVVIASTKPNKPKCLGAFSKCVQ